MSVVCACVAQGEVELAGREAGQPWGDAPAPAAEVGVVEVVPGVNAPPEVNCLLDDEAPRPQTAAAEGPDVERRITEPSAPYVAEVRAEDDEPKELTPGQEAWLEELAALQEMFEGEELRREIAEAKDARIRAGAY
jgi:hypothetical protein